MKDLHSLKRKFKNSKSSKVVHFSLMTSLDSKYSALLKDLNRFFQSLLLTGVVTDPMTFESFSLGARNWTFYIELQDSTGSNIESVKNSLLAYMPLLAYCATFESPPSVFDIDQKARRVCTYLRALNNGTINRKFQPGKKLIIFVIDKSGSMADWQIHSAIDNAIKIFHSHVNNDDFVGVFLFDKHIHERVPLQLVSESNRDSILDALDKSRSANGGYSMYKALNDVMKIIAANETKYTDAWIICLTDGISDDIDKNECQNNVMKSPPKMNIVMIGINLPVEYRQSMKDLCSKYGCTKTKGLFISADANSISLNEAFQEAALNIPVSQSFDLDGPLTTNDCRDLMKIHEPKFFKDGDMLLRKCWIEFLYRRVKVFDENDSFNYNEKYDNLGSSLMKIMLMEAEKLLLPKQNRNWISLNHEQLIYDFNNPTSPEFRLICTAPHLIDPATKNLYDGLNLPGFYIPSRDEMSMPFHISLNTHF